MRLVDYVKMFFLTKKAQNVILEKVKITNKKSLRSVNKTFGSVRSEVVAQDKLLGGSYEPILKKIRYYGSDHMNMHVAIHENLHAASEVESNEYSNTLPYSIRSIGFQKNNKYFVEYGQKCYNEWLMYGSSINEGFNEYFTRLLLKENGLEAFQICYPERITIISPFFYKLGDNNELLFDKESANEMFSLFIMADLDGVVDYISKKYNSPRERVLKLVLEMDMIEDAEQSKDVVASEEWTSKSIQTTLEICFDKFHSEHPNLSKNDFMHEFDLDSMFAIDGSKYVERCIENAKINFLMSEQHGDKHKNVDFDNFLVNLLFDANSNNKVARSIAKPVNSTKILRKTMIFDPNYVDKISGFSDIEKINLILFCAKMNNVCFKNITRFNFMKNFAQIIAEYGMPKGKEAKDEAMFYLLNLPIYSAVKAYKNFTPKEIVDYVSNDKQHKYSNLKCISKSPDLKEYLHEEIIF